MALHVGIDPAARAAGAETDDVRVRIPEQRAIDAGEGAFDEGLRFRREIADDANRLLPQASTAETSASRPAQPTRRPKKSGLFAV